VNERDQAKAVALLQRAADALNEEVEANAGDLHPIVEAHSRLADQITKFLDKLGGS